MVNVAFKTFNVKFYIYMIACSTVHWAIFQANSFNKVEAQVILFDEKRTRGTVDDFAKIKYIRLLLSKHEMDIIQ